MTYRGIVWPIAALGMISLATGASAEEAWPNYAPRCPTPELSVDPALQPELCGGRMTAMGPTAAMMLGSALPLDVEATGSIRKAPPEEPNTSR
jgi:hypothetical protein